MASASACNYPFLPSLNPPFSSNFTQSHFSVIKYQMHLKNSTILSSRINFNTHSLLRPSIVRAVAEQETSPPPSRTRLFRWRCRLLTSSAQGTMNDAVVTKALQEVEGIADLKVQVLEGIASVELNETNNRTSYWSGFEPGRDDTGFRLQIANFEFELPG